LKNIVREFPFSEVQARSEGSGIALYSRFPFEQLPLNLPEGDVRPGILVRLDAGDAHVSLLTIHPRAPIRRGHFELRNDVLASAADCLNSLPEPKVCIGDLNCSTFSAFHAEFVRRTGLRSAREGIGVLPSWPTFLGFRWMMIPIDHCFVSHDICVIKSRTGERIGSDHLPLLVELALKSPASH